MQTALSPTGSAVTSTPFESQKALKAALGEEALKLGFDVMRVTRAAVPSQVSAAFDAFIAGGYCGEMIWMADTADRRRHPQALWPEAKSVVMLGLNYGPEADPLALLDKPEEGLISVYARGRDYHDVLKRKLKALARWLADKTGSEVKVFVDTAPILEKPLAEAAGLGWQGKHTNLVSRTFGSWLFLGEILTTCDLPFDAPEQDHCGTCRQCLDICPTQAFLDAYQIDARRCISYLTIEHKGHIPRDLRPLMGNRIYGCDDCLAICPWNKFAAVAHETALNNRAELEAPALVDMVRLSDTAFRSLFSGSPIKRIGRDRFVRNVLIAIGNSGSPELADTVELLCGDSSSLVRAMAVWALFRLNPNHVSSIKSHFLQQESDATVREEWTTV